MRKWVGMWTCLLSFAMLLSMFSVTAQAYDVSGFVSYSTSKRVYLSIQTQNGRFGTSLIPSPPGAYTIQGVPAGSNYVVQAFVDSLDTGSRHVSDPYGSSASFNVTTAAVPDINISSFQTSVPATIPTPTGLTVLPADGGAFIMWKSGNNGAGELADSYDLFWSMSPNAATTYTQTGGGTVNIPATGDMRGFILPGLTNGVQYYFAISAKIGAASSLPSAEVGPQLIGQYGSYSVSGTVTFPSGILPAGVPMMIGVVTNTSNGPPSQFFSGMVVPAPVTATLVSPVSYTVTGVPNGTYRVYAIFDINKNGLIDYGDLNTSDASAPEIIVSNASVSTGADVTISGASAEAFVRTNHWKNGASEGYGLNFDIEGKLKRPVKVTLQSGPNVTVPIDIAMDDRGKFYSWTGLAARPVSNDAYIFDVVFSDNPSLIVPITGSVTGIVDSFATPTAPVGGPITYSATPSFIWSSPPASPAPPTNYTYQIWLNEQNGGVYWDTDRLLNSINSITFNSDGRASQSVLTVGKSYNWSISVNDVFGNSASYQTSFNFTGGATSWTAYNANTGQNAAVSAKSSDIDWLKTAHSVLSAGQYIKVFNTYYYATGIGGGVTGSYWNDPALYWGNEFAQCDQITGLPTLSATGALVLADLSAINNTLVEGFTTWPLATTSPFSISPTTLTSQSASVPVNIQLSAVGASGAITWTSSTLPFGLTLVSTTGVLSGTTGPGIYSFIVTATDSTSAVSQKFYSLQITQGTGGGGLFSFTSAVNDGTVSTIPNPGLPGVLVQTVGLPVAISTTTDSLGSYTLSNIPANTPFSIRMSLTGFADTYSHEMTLAANADSSNRPYSLFTPAKLTAWGNVTGNGAIRSRVVDSTNLVSGYITGATVTATNAITNAVYPVYYVDTLGALVTTGATTYSNGIYIIPNVPAGAKVNVTASAAGYTSFVSRTFTVHADSVSASRIVGTATAVTPAPAVPTGLSLTVVNSNQINVNWTASTGATYYKIFRNGATTPVGTPNGATNTFWPDSALLPSTNYSYTVAACDAANNCSSQTAPASATTVSGTITTGPVNITGTISYTGSKTGRVYVSIQTNNGNLGTSVPWSTGMTSAPYTIRGVPSNNLNNNLNVFMDIAGNGVRSASSPAALVNNSLTVKDITLTDPAAAAPLAPSLVEVKPGPGSVFIMWQGGDVVDADSYDVYWSNSASVSSISFTGSKLDAPVGMDSPLVINGLTNGSVLYFQVVAKRGTYSTPSAVTGPITVGATTGLNTVSGTVTYSGTIPANTPLYVAVVAANSNKGMGNLYFTSIASASASQAYTISGIPDGSYNVYAILDLNNDNMFAGGDATNTKGDQAPIITLSGNAGKTGNNVTLISKNAEVEITTDHSKNVGGTSSSYSVNGRVSGQSKRPVTVVLTGKPTSSTLTVPMDIGISSNNNNEFEFWGDSSVTSPAVGGIYTFSVTYSDGFSEDKTGAITGVSSNFPTNPNYTLSTIPKFSWSAPSPLPTGSYQYSLWVNSIGNNKMWEAWSIPSSQLEIVYGSGSFSSAKPLQTSIEYSWSISTRDQDGNRATVQGNFTPTSVAPSDTVAPTITSIYPTNGATGVTTDTQISVTFSELVAGMPSKEASLKNNTTGQYVVGTGSGSADGLTYTFKPDVPLAPGTTYSVQLSTVTDLAGNALPPTTLTFTTAGVVVSHTVTFNSNGGSAVTSQSVVSNATATAPGAPTKAGNSFAGWYTDAGLTSAFTFTTPITANTTLYAKWLAVDSAPPTIISSTPASNATNVSVDVIPAITFSEAVKEALLQGAIILRAGSTQITGTVSYNAATNTATFTPSTSLAMGTTYNLSVGNMIEDLAGNKLNPTTIFFKTGFPSGDIDGANGVDIADAYKMLEIAVGRVTATPLDLKRADIAPLVNGQPMPDGKIDVADVVVILRRIVGLVSW